MKITRSRNTEELADAFADLIAEGREMLGEVVDRPAKSSANLRETLGDVGRKLADFQTSATRAAQAGAAQTTRAARRADEYVHDNPWPAIAGGIAIGVLAASFWLTQRR